MKSWRAVLPIHPAAELFPLMSPAELKKLGEDIKQNGLRNPCRLIEDEDGQVVLIDGRNRLDALELIGEEIILNNSVIFERVPLISTPPRSSSL
jgi:ParB-like chromosome segregation protein Spo0J